MAIKKIVKTEYDRNGNKVVTYNDGSVREYNYKDKSVAVTSGNSKTVYKSGAVPTKGRLTASSLTRNDGEVRAKYGRQAAADRAEADKFNAEWSKKKEDIRNNNRREWELASKVKDGSASELDYAISEDYRKLRANAANELWNGEYHNKMVTNYRELVGQGGYIPPASFDEMIKQLDIASSAFEKWSDYNAIYGSDEEEAAMHSVAWNYAEMKKNAESMKESMSAFQNSDDYEAYKAASSVTNYSELEKLQKEHIGKNGYRSERTLDYLNEMYLLNPDLQYQGGEDGYKRQTAMRMKRSFAYKSNTEALKNEDEWKRKEFERLSGMQAPSDPGEYNIWLNDVSSRYGDSVNRNYSRLKEYYDAMKKHSSENPYGESYSAPYILEGTEQLYNDDYIKLNIKWNNVKNNADFEKRSGVEYPEPKVGPGNVSNLYGAINYNHSTTGDGIGDDYETLDVRSMTDEQRKIYNYLYNTEGEKKAKEYFEDLRKGELQYKRSAKKAKFISDRHKYWGSQGFWGDTFNLILDAAAVYADAATALPQFIGGSISSAVGSNEMYEEFTDPGFASAVSGKEMTENMGGLSKFGYNALREAFALISAGKTAKVMSGGNLKRATRINQLLTSSRAANSTLRQYIDSGEDPVNAIGMSIVNGSIEWFTEKISPLEKFMKNPGVYTAKEKLIEIGKGAGTEAMEEVTANFMTTIAAAITDNNKQDTFLAAFDKGKADGMSDGKAFWKAVCTVIPEYAEAALVGGLVGGAFSASNTISSSNHVTAVRDDAITFFDENGINAKNIRQYMDKIRYTAEGDKGNLTTSIALNNMVSGRWVSPENEKKIKSDPTLTGILYGLTETNSRNRAIEAAAKKRQAIADGLSEKSSAEPELKELYTERSIFSEAERTVYNALGEHVTVKTADNIMNSPELTEVFEKVTGVKLEGTNAQKRATIREYSAEGKSYDVVRNNLNNAVNEAEGGITVKVTDDHIRLAQLLSSEPTNDEVRSIINNQKLSTAFEEASGDKLWGDYKRKAQTIKDNYKTVAENVKNAQESGVFTLRATDEKIDIHLHRDSASERGDGLVTESTAVKPAENDASSPGEVTEVHNIMSESSPEGIMAEMGSYASKMYNDAMNTESGTGMISAMMARGMSRESAQKAVSSVFSYMYEAGRKGWSKASAVAAVEKYIAKGVSKEAEAFYAVGVLEGKGTLRGKKSAKLIRNSVLKKKISKSGRLNFDELKTFEQLARMTGCDIEFADGLKNDMGESVNALFDAKKGRILIDADCDSPYLTAAIHESIHAIREIAPKEYNELKKAVFDLLKGHDGLIDEELKKTYDMYLEESDKGANVDYLEEETIARVVSEVLTDESVVESLATTDQKLMARIREALTRFFNKLLGRYKGRTERAYTSEAVRLLGQDIETVMNFYDKALQKTESLRGNRTTFAGKSVKKSSKKGLKNSSEGGTINENGEQYRVMWTIEEGVLDNSEVKHFYNLVGEKKRGMKFPLSFEGETIFEIDNKLIYVDTDYLYPSISRVMMINSDDVATIEDCKEVIFDGEEDGIESEGNIETAEIMFGQGIIAERNFVDSEAYRRERDNRRKASRSITSDIGSGEDVKRYSKKVSGIFDKHIGTKSNIASKEDISRYVDYAYYYAEQTKNQINPTFPKQKDRIVISKVSSELAKEVMAMSGMDISKAYHSIRDNDIRHIKNSHGEETYEKYPVTKEDIKNIPDIIENYDDVIYLESNGKRGIYFVKRHNGVTYYLESINDKGTALTNKQMIKVSTGTIPDIPGLKEAIIKKWNITSSPNDNSVPRVYVQDVLSNHVPNDNITHNSKIVNKEMSSKKSSSVKPADNSKPMPNLRSPASHVLTKYALEMKAEVLAKLEEEIKKYGAMEKGVDPARDVTVPNKTSDDKYVRRYARSAAESELIDDETAEKIMEEIASGEFWTTYERAGNKKAVLAAQVKLKRYGYEAMLDKWYALVDSGARIVSQDIVEAQVLLSQAVAQNDTENVARLLADISAEGTRSGQVSQALILVKRMGPAAKLTALQRTVDNINRDLINKRGAKAPEVEVDQKLLEEYTEALNEEAKRKDGDTEKSDAKLEEIYRDVGQQIPGTWGDKLRAWRYFAMLGNPRTHIRNMLGNLMFSPVIFTKNIIASGGEAAVSKVLKLFGKDMQRTKSFGGLLVRGEVLDFAKNDAKAIEDILKGEAKYGASKKAVKHMRIFKREWRNKLVDGNSNLLEKEDWFFLKRHYARALTQYIKANKLDIDTLEGTQLDKARMYAIREAQRATFREKSKLAEALSMAAHRSKAADFAIESIVPYKRTPINILRQGIRYSPAGIVSTISTAVQGVIHGKYSGAELIDGLAQNITGTGLMVLGAALMSGLFKGVRLQGPDDDDDKKSKFLKALGKQSYSLVFADGSSYTIDWLSPAAMSIFVGGEIYNALAEGGLTLGDTLDIMAKITQPIFEMSMLEGLAKVAENASYAPNGIVALAEMIIQIPLSYVGQFVPTGLGQLTRTMDNTRRRTYIDKNSDVPAFLQSLIQQQMKKIPWLSEKLEPYVNAKGEVQKNAEGNVVMRALQNFLSPGYYKTKKETAVDKELIRLVDTIGEDAEKILPKDMGKEIQVGDETRKLTAKQYTEYQTAVGREYYEQLSDIISSDYYKELGDSDKAKLLEEAYKYAVQVGRKAVFEDYDYGSSQKLVDKFESEDGYQFVITPGEGESGKVDAKKLLGGKYGEYEKKYKALNDELIKMSKVRSDDRSLESKYREEVYEYAKATTLADMLGNDNRLSKWQVVCKNLTKEQQAEYIYGRSLMSMYEDGSEKDNAIYNSKEISDVVKIHLVNSGWAEKYTAFCGRYNIAPRVYLAMKQKEANDEFAPIEKTDTSKAISKKERVCNYINSLAVDNRQKSALFRAMGYSDVKETEKSEPLKYVKWSYTRDMATSEEYEKLVGKRLEETRNWNKFSDAAVGQCVWYVRNRAYSKLGKVTPALGNANEMYNNAKAGAKVEATADNLKGDMLLVYKQGTSSAGLAYGHVIYIEAVEGDTVYYTEGGRGYYDNRTDGILKKSTRDDILKGIGDGGTVGSYALGLIDITKY